MKPLRDAFDRTDPNEAAGAALLSRIPPLEASSARRRRVRMALQGSSPRRSARVVGPVLVAAVLLVAATAASATATRLWKVSHLWRAPDATGRAVIDAAPRAPVASIGLVARLDGPLPASPPRLSPRAPTTARAVAPAAPAAIPGPAADPSSGPGASLMVEAMQARKAGDSARSAALLAEYQRKYPQGAFQEEALALSIEAASSRGSESAPRLATDYLRRYPNGRFRELAQRALKSSPR